jgi:hypothetical protein
MKADNENPIIIWRLTDNKPGHQSQTLGLVEALKRKQACQSFDIPVSGRLQPMLNLLTSTWPAGRGLPLPDLIIGAGHRTHLHMLAASRVYGGRTIVMMQPSLPVNLFDLCLIPEHDHYQGNGRFLETRGVLNPLQAEGRHRRKKSLVMIGGPSKHCDWNADHLTSQLVQLSRQNPEQQFCLTTSRRTPADFVTHLAGLALGNVDIVPFEETGPGWVAQQMADSYSAWVTEDSASMVYEALTAQTAVGILNMPLKRESRVSRGIQKLVEDRLVSRFDTLGHYKQQLHPVAGFIESDRCANWILERWLQPLPVLQPQPVAHNI